MVFFDEVDFGLRNSKWVSLGEFELSLGRVGVILSDKEVLKRKEVPIVADAVKFVRVR